MKEEITCHECETKYLVGSEKTKKRPGDYLAYLNCGERLINNPKSKTIYFIIKKLQDGIFLTKSG